MCGTFSNRAITLSHSTFALVPPPESGNGLYTSPVFLNRLAEALRVGAVPVIPGKAEKLPLSEYINWEKACLIIPRVSSLFQKSGIYGDV